MAGVAGTERDEIWAAVLLIDPAWSEIVNAGFGQSVIQIY